ncbi:MAG TPA: hypothetical protein EYP59_14235 [Thiotrichaceae bacterium]|nr:hypothetical protein [Thiotrichaceae bacterium]
MLHVETRCLASLGLAFLGLTSLGLASLGIVSIGIVSIGIAETRSETRGIASLQVFTINEIATPV